MTASLEGPDLEAERIVVGTLIRSAPARVSSLHEIAPEECYSAPLADVLRILRDLHRAGEEIDPAAVWLESRRRGLVVDRVELANLPYCADSNLRTYIEEVRSDAQDRDSRGVARQMLKGRDPLPTADAARALHEIAARNGSIGWAAYAVAGDQYLDLPCNPPASIIGDGLLSRGDLGILYGEGGRGKSYLTMQLARSVTLAEPWIGLAGPVAHMCVGVASLEIPRHVMQQRIAAVFGGPAPSQLKAISQTEMVGGRPDLLDPRSVRGLIGWIHAHALDLVILDAFSRFWSGDEMQDASKRMAVCDDIRWSTGCAILWVHHERKAMAGQAIDDDLAALRSSTRYQTDPTVLLRLTQSKGLTVLRVAKTNFAAIPAPVYLARNPDGTLRTVQSPESSADKTRDRILQILIANPSGIAPKRIQDETGYAKATVYRHLKALDAENVGAMNAPVYCLKSHESHEPRETASNPLQERTLDDAW